MKAKVKLSPFNINYAFKDREHIELLKKQIEAGFEPPIDVYEEDEIKYVIDGGHTWEAYKELGKELKNIHMLEFSSDADKIAYSRHKNINTILLIAILAVLLLLAYYFCVSHILILARSMDLHR